MGTNRHGSNQCPFALSDGLSDPRESGHPGAPPGSCAVIAGVTEDRPHTDMHAGSDHRAEKLALICQTPLAPRAMFAQGEDVLACKYDQSLLLAGALQFDGHGIPRTLGQAEVVNLKPIILPFADLGRLAVDRLGDPGWNGLRGQHGDPPEVVPPVPRLDVIRLADHRRVDTDLIVEGDFPIRDGDYNANSLGEQPATRCGLPAATRFGLPDYRSLTFSVLGPGVR